MNIQEFARTFEVSRSVAKRTALVIGFAGGSALLHHSQPEAMFADLQGDARGEGRLGDTGRLWTEKVRSGGGKSFLEKHTRTRDNYSPDARALRCIAGLLQGGYIRAVVATDTGHGLRSYLRSHITAMEEFDSGTRPEKLHAIRDTLHEQPAFIDGAEMLLLGFRESLYRLNPVPMNETRRALREFLSEFERILCWGWCDRNVYLNTICDPDQRTHLYFLGSYSYCTTTDWGGDYDVVVDPPERPEANTEIIHKLCSLLPEFEEPRERGPAVVMPSQASALVYIKPLAMPMAQCLLWPAEVLDNLVERVTGPRISITGVDGELMRTSLAQWLVSALGQRGRECHSRMASDIVTLGRHITMLTSAGDATCVIGELSDGAGGEREWIGPLTTYILRWANAEAAEDQHVALFVPAALARWASRVYAGQEFIYVHTLDSSKCLVPEQVEEWLEMTLDPLLNLEDADDAEIKSLAVRMVRDARARGGSAGDWLHEALSLWEHEVRRELGENATLGDDGGRDPDAVFGVDGLSRLWQTLVERYRQLDEKAVPDFDFADIQIYKREDPDNDPDSGSGGSPDPNECTDPDSGATLDAALDQDLDAYPGTGRDADPDTGPGPDVDPGPSGVDQFDLGPITPTLPGRRGETAK